MLRVEYGASREEKGAGVGAQLTQSQGREEGGDDAAGTQQLHLREVQLPPRRSPQQQGNHGSQEPHNGGLHLSGRNQKREEVTSDLLLLSFSEFSLINLPSCQENLKWNRNLKETSYSSVTAIGPPLLKDKHGLIFCWDPQLWEERLNLSPRLCSPNKWMHESMNGCDTLFLPIGLGKIKIWKGDNIKYIWREMVSYIDGGKTGTGILEETLDVHYPYTLRSSLFQGNNCTYGQRTM